MDYPTFNGILENCHERNDAAERSGRPTNAVADRRMSAYWRANSSSLRAEASQTLKLSNHRRLRNRSAHGEERCEREGVLRENCARLCAKRPSAITKNIVSAKRKFTRRRQGGSLWPWDQPFYEKMLQREKYSVDSRKVQEYFPMNRVVDGLFSITQSLYGLEYRDITDSRAQRRPAAVASRCSLI